MSCPLVFSDKITVHSLHLSLKVRPETSSSASRQVLHRIRLRIVMRTRSTACHDDGDLGRICTIYVHILHTVTIFNDAVN